MILVYGYERDVKRRLSIKVPGHVVDDLAHDALVQGDRRRVRRHLGRRVPQLAAHDRRPHRRRLLPARRAPPEGDDPPQRARRRGGRLGRRAVVDSEAGAVELRIIVEEVLETFNEKHRLVIELHVFGGLTAGEVCDRIEGMSEDNVAQIASRFRAKLRARLDPTETDR